MTDDKINSIYSDISNPGGFSGVLPLLKAVKKKFPEVTKDDIKKFIERNRTYSLFK